MEEEPSPPESDSKRSLSISSNDEESTSPKLALGHSKARGGLSSKAGAGSSTSRKDSGVGLSSSRAGVGTSSSQHAGGTATSRTLRTSSSKVSFAKRGIRNGGSVMTQSSLNKINQMRIPGKFVIIVSPPESSRWPSPRPRPPWRAGWP